MSGAERRTRFVNAAHSQEGYRAQPGKQSIFREQAGDWNGAFVGWAARQAGFDAPDFTSTTAAFAWYTRCNRVYRNPQVGDVAFYAFGFDGGEGAPHVGIVTDTTRWRDLRAFRAVEAQTWSGQPKATTDRTGVFERTRYQYDVAGFARPAFGKVRFDLTGAGEGSGETRPGSGLPIVTPGHITSGVPGGIVLVQGALRGVVGLRGERSGVWDGPTRAAYGAWLRQNGLRVRGTENGAYPDFGDLRALSIVAGTFTV